VFHYVLYIYICICIYLTHSPREYVALAAQSQWYSKNSSNLFRYNSHVMYPIYYCLSFLHFPAHKQGAQQMFPVLCLAHTYFSRHCLWQCRSILAVKLPLCRNQTSATRMSMQHRNLCNTIVLQDDTSKNIGYKKAF
jgi:hypothetical protein